MKHRIGTDQPSLRSVGNHNPVADLFHRLSRRARTTTNPHTAYDIALRPDDLGQLDDVVVNRVEMFRAEMMDDRSLWLCCYLEGGERITFWVSAPRRPLRFVVTDIPDDDRFRYESDEDAATCVGVGWAS